MILVPVSTDAPHSHFPYATIGLMIANVLCFAATGCAMSERLLEPWLLQYGDGLNPLEWLPAAFAHTGFFQLIINMFFLWGFGLVVEGRLGWRVFMSLYLGLAAAWGLGADLATLHRTDDYVLRNELYHEWGVETRQDLQELMDATDEEVDRQLARVKGRCTGATGVVFGLMMISLVWAPKNSLRFVILVAFIWLFSVDVSLLLVSASYLVLTLLVFSLSADFGSFGVQFAGCAAGLLTGLLFLKCRWVDCENQDLLSVWNSPPEATPAADGALSVRQVIPGIRRVPPAETTETVQITPEEQQEQRMRKLLFDAHSYIDAGDYQAALEELVALRLKNVSACPDAERTKRLALGLLRQEAWDDAEVWLREYIDRYADQCEWARIRLAQLLLLQMGRPQAALKLLKGLRTQGMSEQLQKLAKHVSQTAREQIRQGVTDRDGEW